MSQASAPRETESVLFVCASDPKSVLAQVAALRELAGYRLLPGADEHIRDTYVDTPDHALRARHIGLRVRRKDGQVLLTLKGDVERGDWGVRRFERELPWSGEALPTLAGDLRTLGAPVSLRPDASGSSDPLEALARSGLATVQDRETFRRVRQVTAAGGDETLAELSTDSSIYHLRGGDVRCCEIEVEQKAGDTGLVRRLCDELRARFAVELRPWPYSKLATGYALESLQAEHGREYAVSPDGTLKPSQCGRLESALAALGSD